MEFFKCSSYGQPSSGKLASCEACSIKDECRKAVYPDNFNRHVCTKFDVDDCIDERPYLEFTDFKTLELADQCVSLADAAAADPEGWRCFKEKALNPSKPLSELAVDTGYSSKQAFYYRLLKFTRTTGLVKALQIAVNYNHGRSGYYEVKPDWID